MHGVVPLTSQLPSHVASQAVVSLTEATCE